jgi:hypothetical protein
MDHLVYAAPHPSDTAPGGCALAGLRAEHPRPDPVRSMLAALAVHTPMTRGPSPALVATLDTPGGRVELR